MRSLLFRLVSGVGLLLALAACGAGGEGPGAPPPPTAPTPLGQAISAAALDPTNDSSVHPTSAFKVLQDNGVPAVTVTGAPVVRFTVFSDRAVRQGLALANVSVAIAKLVPGANGEIDRWVNYVYRTETATAGVGPGGTPVLASAAQAINDPKPAGMANQLVYHADGYYIYTFSTDITDPARTRGVTFEPDRTHRVALQLSYTNAAGETIRVNPYFDVTFDAAGRSLPVTDASRTRVMSDVASCNGCHEKLALHGGGRVDVQYCVLCHNPGTTDANSGHVLTMATMTHKIHAGRLLKAKLDAGQGGEEYTLWGFRDSRHEYARVGFPQDLRNCTVCHSGANPQTPQGDLWQSRVSKEACLTCHASGAGSTFDLHHRPLATVLVAPGAPATQIANADCAFCHRPGTALSPERVHWNQNEENAARYRLVIEEATFDAAARRVRVRYHLEDPTQGNARYNLVTADCTGAGATLACSNQTRFGNLSFFLAYANVVGQPAQVTEFTAFNNAGSSAQAFLFRGANDGGNRYTIEIPLPADSATAVAQGTARVISIGQIKEPRLALQSAADPRPEVAPRELINVVVQHTHRDVVLSGAFNPRRQVVANAKCNVCHGALGTTTGSNTVAEAFHGGARNTVESCTLCHDPNRFSSTVMTNGLALSENYSFKRMIHGIHGNLRRSHPFTHGNAVIGAFGIDGLLLATGFASGTVAAAPLGTEWIPYPTATSFAAGTPLAATVENYAAEVAYPSLGLSCNACHVNDSWRRDLGTVGAVVARPLTGAATPLAVDMNPLAWRVISPRAATCSSCHDSAAAIEHMVSAGGSTFGTRTQGQWLLEPRETCDDCHASGQRLGVDVVHGMR